MPSFSSFDEEFGEAKVTKRGQEWAKFLPDGNYEAEIKAGVAQDLESGPIWKIMFQVLSPDEFLNRKAEQTTFLSKKNGTDAEKREYTKKKLDDIKSDLSALGFDVENWTTANKRPFSEQLRIAGDVMAGIKVKITKKTNGDFVNVYIGKRLEDGKPLKFTAADMVPTGAAEQHTKFATSTTNNDRGTPIPGNPW